MRNSQILAVLWITRIKILEQYDFGAEVTLANLHDIIQSEDQCLAQIQADIEIHREENLEAIQKQSATEQNKPLSIIIKEINHRGKYLEERYNIQYKTKARRTVGVERLGIPIY